MGFPEQMCGVETGTYAGILSLDHSRRRHTPRSARSHPAPRERHSASYRDRTETEIYRDLRSREAVDELRRLPSRSLISGADANLATHRGDSGLETKTAPAASKALCALRRETRLADRAAEREALPEPAVAVTQ